MNEDAKIPVQEVVDMLVERIATLELEVAVLRTMLNQKIPKESKEETTSEEKQEQEPGQGQYL